MPDNNPYLGSKDAQIALFDNLILHNSSKAAVCRRENIGTYAVASGGNIMPMYRVGNPYGGKFMCDGAIHGASDVSTIVYYYFLRWLLESNDPQALNILAKKCVLMVPIVNWTSVRKNDADNVHGVDLNRNFLHNWTSAGSTDPLNQQYRGPSPASEPETQALRTIFTNEQPEVYINFHNWGGPFLSGRYANTTQQTRNAQLNSQYQALATSMGVEPYAYSATSLPAGQASADAAITGANSFLAELVDSINNVYPNYNARPTFDMIEPYYFPRALPLLITLANAVSDGPPIENKKWLFANWQDSDLNNPRTITT